MIFLYYKRWQPTSNGYLRKLCEKAADRLNKSASIIVSHDKLLKLRYKRRMIPSARYQAVIELVDMTMVEPRPADALTSLYFRDRRYIGSKDRANILTRYYRILRHIHRLNWWHEKIGYTPTARTYVIADSVLASEQTHENLTIKLFNGTRYAPDKLSAAEDKMAWGLREKNLNDPEMPDRIRLECPEWVWEPMSKAYGVEESKRILAAMQAPNDLHLRVNTLKNTREAALEALKDTEFEMTAGALSPWTIRVKGRPQISQNTLFNDGRIEVQNEGSQLIALVCDVKPGMKVVDFCAGAGGKTLALAAQMNNKGKIVACDVLSGRLNRSKKRFQRAGVHNVETRPLANERDKWVKRHKEQFDVVLVDAPCSGVGTWRGDPDKRWRQLGPGLSELVPLQAEILDSAARLVKPGGRLVYATCSLLPAENEIQTQNFLNAHPDFKLADLPETVPDSTRVKGYMKANPADHDCDGFFAAVMERAAAKADDKDAPAEDTADEAEKPTV